MKVLIGFCILAVALAARPEVKKTCTEKPETGMCMALFRMWYYDPETGSCKRFVYGGCQGNGNRYSTEEECLENCKEVTAGPLLLSDHHDVDCNALPNVGMCDALMPRFFYDPLEGKCKRFIYGGCGGNSNNFKAEEECNKKCADSDDVFDALPMPFSCDCESGNSTCACCGQLKVSTIKLDKKVCVEVGYDDKKVALKVAITANGKILFNKSISATNPPAVCVGMPPMHMFADVCFDFYDIKVREKIHFCLNVKPRLLTREIGDIKVGCFNFNRGSIEDLSTAVNLIPTDIDWIPTDI